MIPNIVRGDRMVGLMMYLQGPGRENEHEYPHVVAGQQAVLAFGTSGELSRDDAVRIAEALDESRLAFGTRVEVVNRRAAKAAVETGTPASVAVADATRAAHVWHCSLSLKSDEGRIGDEKWASIARDFMKEMSFDDPDDPRAPARWVAVHHGLSKNGGDHIHIVASAVRTDGTKMHLRDDYAKAQKACNLLEHRYGLTVLASREQDRGDRWLKPAEQAREDRGEEVPRLSLERRVRAHAVASKTEGEFVRRVRADGLLIRPRFERGGQDEVVGYSVAVTPRDGKTIWFGGGRLAKDLTLPRLRDEWDQSADAARDAIAEWRAVSGGKPAVVAAGRETIAVDSKLIERAAADIEAWNRYLATIPLKDHAQWARAASRTAGVFAAWSARTESVPGPLAHAARQLRQSGQVRSGQRWRADVHRPKLSAGGAALILLQARTHDKSAAYTLLLHQLMQTVRAISDARSAVGDADYAYRLETMLRTDLQALHERSGAVSPRAQAPSSTVTVGLDAEASEALDDAREDTALPPQTSVRTNPEDRRAGMRKRGRDAQTERGMDR